MGQTHRDHDDTPDGHYCGNENRGSEALEQDVGQGLEESVGDEEDGQTGIILTTGDFQGLLQAVELGVADVGAVEEGDEVQEA